MCQQRKRRVGQRERERERETETEREATHPDQVQNNFQPIFCVLFKEEEDDRLDGNSSKTIEKRSSNQAKRARNAKNQLTLLPLLLSLLLTLLALKYLNFDPTPIQINFMA